MKTTLFTLLAIVASSLLLNAQEAKVPLAEESSQIDKNSILGYWIADSVAIAATLMEEQKEAVDAGEVTKEDIEKRAKMFSSMMVMHYSEDESTAMHTVSGVKKGKYKIVSIRKDKREIDIDISSESDGVEQGTFRFTETRVILSARGSGGKAPQIALKRISEIEAKPMIKAIKSKVEQGGSDQSAAAPELKPEGEK